MLESQLVGYHENDSAYRFLNKDTINNFSELYVLFHEVLNKTIADRKPSIVEKYARIPYLNSSLFDFSEVENMPPNITVDQLDDNLKLTLPNTSILKKNGETESSLPTLEYLFRFLDAYDFASEGKEGVQKENRSLINASVLGKVFEKINGYKDGSFYTPGFITMYMCRQAIRLAVVRKFKDEYDLDIETFNDLYVFVSKFNKTDKILEFNNLINDLKLCDPAVGSGHFLVSALNEILAIKSELGIFASDDGKPFNQYAIKIANDEIIVTDRENKEFRYVMRDGKPLNDEMQNLQKTLFHEKQTLIENCLFGVDINPNSVKICRLRLWIELLKNAYYKEADNFRELETLPNIDINIKKGNSLLSRFALDADLKEALKTIKYSVKDYQSFVQGYKETRDRETKRDFEAKIKRIKDDFKVQLNHLSPERIKLADLNNQLKASESRQYLFGESDADKAARFKKEEKLRADIEKQNEKIRAIENNAIYKNAFEWRFEFPEVLDNDGNFLGFDIVIGNPPYLQLSKTEDLNQEYKEYLLDKFKTSGGRLNTFIFFIHQAYEILKNKGELAFIIPNTILTQEYYAYTREFLLTNTKLHTIINYDNLPFEFAVVENVSLLFSKNSESPVYDIDVFRQNEIETTLLLEKRNIDFLSEHNTVFAFNTDAIIETVYKNSELLKHFVEINQAIALKGDKTLSLRDKNPNNLFYKLLDGRNINKYVINWGNVYLDYNLDRIHSCKRKDIFESEEKLFFRRVSSTLIFTYDDEQFFALNTLVVLNSKNHSNLELKYLLSVLNSKLLNYVYINKFKSTKTVFSEIQANTVGQLPIKKISPEAQAPFIKLVDEILRLKKHGEGTTEQENEIDEMVYDLYELTDAERKIVKGAT